MNEFLEQFVAEGRELAQKATEDLLALEDSPRDKALIDSVFRGFHTLKGAAGIVDFPAMGRVLHAAEDVLARVRSGDRPPSAELIGDCLACLDQVGQWLDAIEAKGGLPVVPDLVADALMTRFERVDAPAEITRVADDPPLGPSIGPPAWLDDFLIRHAARRSLARTALHYAPARDCFFRGDDPLDLVARLPDILALEVTPNRPWPPLEDIDPFECNVTITVLTSASPEDVAVALNAVSDQVDIRPLAEPGPEAASEFSPQARAVLEEQLLLVAEDGTEGYAGRLGSAGRIAVIVSRQAGRTAEMPRLRAALEQSQREGNGLAFTNALQALLGWPAAPAGEAPVAPVQAEALVTPVAGDIEDPAPAMVVRALRVDVDRIDALVKLAGELTVAKNAIGHVTRLAQDRADPDVVAAALKDQHALLNRLVGQLHQSVLGIRVLPLRHVFQRFPRLVREISRDLGKSVRLVMEGEETEADKATVEALFEPILHVVRNALDHGVEHEPERHAAGKPPIAQLRLSAVRDGDHVIVEVTDDGRGIDMAEVRKVAARRGVASADALAQMTDAETVELIFAPGFSTAAAVTDVSGRGVGMDVVRSAIARMGGQVTVTSQLTRGTNVRFMLPFTVMMLRVVTVDAGGQMFGIPIDAVIETAQMPRDRISRLGAAEAIVLRERTVPLVRLSETLDLPRRCENPYDGPCGPGAADARIVVVTVAGQTGAIEVDGFGERMDVMLKPMEGLLAGTSGVAGTTLLGDGRVLILLDLQELLR